MLNSNGANVKTYVGSDGLLHFTDWSGADSVIPFSVLAKESKLSSFAWKAHSSTTFTASQDCYVIAGVSAGTYSTSKGISASAKITTTGTQITYLGNSAPSSSSNGGISGGTLGIYKLATNQAVTVSGSGANVGTTYKIYHTTSSSLDSLIEGLTWTSGSLPFTATGRCVVIVYASAATFIMGSTGTALVDVKTTSNEIIIDSGEAHSPIGSTYGKIVSNMTMCICNGGDTVSATLVGSNVGHPTKVLYAMVS